MAPKVTIIIPVKKIDELFRSETIPAILNQSYKNYEIIFLPDRSAKERFPKTRIISTWPKVGPADKRDIGVQKARGEILAFLDDDSYPDKKWLENAVSFFTDRTSNGSRVAAVCGPTLTPASDNLRQKASGYVWSSWLGSGGAGVYRCRISPRREVDDYPSVNFLIWRKDFLKVGGFDSQFWPGEDTKLCHDLVYKLGKKIIYDPKVLVYHHRREVFGPHLRQISRYALHRGHFARILPRTSLRMGYFVPTILVLGLIFGFFLSLIHPLFKIIYLTTIGIYLTWILVTALQVFQKEKNLKLSLLVIPSILTTHIVYGALFIKGFLIPNLKSKYQR